MTGDGWEVVFTASGMAQAAIIQGRLSAEGIPVHLKYEAAGHIYAITLDGLGEVRVMVPEAFRDSAKEILSRTYDEEDMDWESS